MTVDVDSGNLFTKSFTTLSGGTDHTYLVSGLPKCGRLHPHAPIHRHGQILDDDEGPSFAGCLHSRERERVSFSYFALRLVRPTVARQLRRRASPLAPAWYFLLKPLRALVTVNEPSDCADTLIQCA